MLKIPTHCSQTPHTTTATSYHFCTNFSGMQSLGLPSFSGLHSILTQEPPSQTYMNIINGWENEVDDIPSYFHSKGYRTMIVNANRFDFDGKQYWIQ